MVGCSPMFPVEWMVADRLPTFVLLSSALNRPRRGQHVHCWSTERAKPSAPVRSWGEQCPAAAESSAPFLHSEVPSMGKAHI